MSITSAQVLLAILTVVILGLLYVLKKVRSEKSDKENVLKTTKADLQRAFSRNDELVTKNHALDEANQTLQYQVEQLEAKLEELRNHDQDLSDYAHKSKIETAAAKIQRAHGAKARDIFKKLFPEFF
ncbi:hypothetical protein SM033_00114 [Vibrio phage vB_VpaM_sm033]|nr:hypothetical protein SM033_00114 [Vibrio phage vB_VpaM_sm033]